MTVYYGWPLVSTNAPAWDAGVRWTKRLVTAPTDLPLSVPYVREKVLRVANDGADTEFIEQAMWAALAAAEHDTQTVVMPQTWAVSLDRFPASGRIELPVGPVRSLTSVAYYDSDNAAQELAGSPADYLLVAAGRDAPAILTPLVGATFPGTAVRGDAVTVTYEAGYDEADPERALILAGIGVMVAEMYKTRSLSVAGQSESPLQLSRFWRRRW